MSVVQTEHVLVVPTALFHEIGYFQGFCGDSARYLQPLLSSGQVSYRPRGEMEEDPSFKQLIPYVIFQHQDEQGAAHLFQYTRGKGQGEARLHAKLSIGIGGHISSDDAAMQQDDPYAEGMRRELDEEVRIDTDYQEQCVGLINDDETEVGKVHLGVVHVFTVATPSVAANEDEIVDAGFRSVTSLREEIDRMESWSRICFEALFEKDS